MNKKNINIYIESSPNPNSLKFIVNFILVPEGETYYFTGPKDANKAPLARKLFNFKYIERVFYMNNFITITKFKNFKWNDIKDKIKNFIKSYLEKNKPLLLENKIKKNETEKEDNEIIYKIKSILNEYIKPVVEQDGGAITFHSFEKGILKVMLQGSCRGCPSASITLKYGIENIIKKIIPEVKSVTSEEF